VWRVGAGWNKKLDGVQELDGEQELDDRLNGEHEWAVEQELDS
jgi:hypothetical protein